MGAQMKALNVPVKFLYAWVLYLNISLWYSAKQA